MAASLGSGCDEGARARGARLLIGRPSLRLGGAGREGLRHGAGDDPPRARNHDDVDRRDDLRRVDPELSIAARAIKELSRR